MNKVLVTIANYDYLEYSKSLFTSAKLNGKWDGDFVLIVPEEEKDKIDEKVFNEKGIFIYYVKSLKSNPPVNFYKIYLLDEYFGKWDWIFYTDLDVLFFNKIELDLDTRKKDYLYANPDGLSFLNQFYTKLDWGISPFNSDKTNGSISKEKKVKDLPKEISNVLMEDCEAFHNCFMLFNKRFIELNYFNKLHQTFEVYIDYFNKLLEYSVENGMEPYKEPGSGLRDQPIFNLVFYNQWKYLNEKFVNRYPLLDKISWNMILLENEYIDNEDYDNKIAVHFFRWCLPWDKNNKRFYPIWKETKDRFELI